VITALGFGLAAAWSDFKGMVIPNLYPALIIAAFIPAYAGVYFFALESNYFAPFLSHLISFVLVFVITYGLFAAKILGGGDAKLCSAFALWAGVSGLAPYLFFMGLIGGALGGITLLLAKYKPIKNPVKDGWIDKAQKGSRQVAYGIAITAGAIISFLYLGYITCFRYCDACCCFGTSDGGR